MLTTHPRRTHSHRTLGLLSVLTALGASLAGCPDALHLDAGGTASTGGVDGGLRCTSNTDCAGPTPVCDTEKQQCFECLVAADCAVAKESTVCSKGQCVCPDAPLTFCPAVDVKPSRCVNTMTENADCGTCNHTCASSCGGGLCTFGWATMSMFGAPDARSKHVAVWDDADKLMIVWGGANPAVLDTGGIYDFVNNSWKPTNPKGAPTAREGATAVWADTMMIVWGGIDAANMPLNTGGKFDPKTNTWTPITTTGAPTARKQHTAVWNGSVMIVWGGNDGVGVVDSGASYDPKTDTWTPTKPGLSARSQHTAVWTGAQMMVWGGLGVNPMPPPPPNVPLADGAGYNPAMDSWDMSPLGGATPSARYRHTAVWTGMSMLVFGGTIMGNMPASDGGQLKNMTWGSLGIANQPEARQDHTAVWMPMTSEMIIWGGQGGGYLDNGYRLSESLLSWTPLPAAMGLTGRARHTAVAAGTQVIIWGGEGSTGPTNTGGIFDTTFK